MRNKRGIAVLGLALLLSLLFASQSLAAPTLGVEISRSPQQINRGDESVSYEVRVRNTSVTDSTSGTLGLALSPSPGLKIVATSGSGWTCSLVSLSCDSSAVVPPGDFYPTLELSNVWIDATAPDTSRLGVTASGAGAVVDVSAEDSFTFGPAIPFGLRFASTGAVSESGEDESQAGAHPYEVSGAFEIGHRRGPLPESFIPIEDLHGGVTELPAGLVANPRRGGEQCEVADLQQSQCPDAAAMGGIRAFMDPGEESPSGSSNAELPKDRVIYRLRREAGYLASFGFRTEGTAFVIRVRLRSDGDYGISQVFPLIPQSPKVYGLSFTLCGYGVKLSIGPLGPEFEGCRKRSDPNAARTALTALGTSCASGPPLGRLSVDSWSHRGAYGDNGLPDLTDPNWSTADIRLAQPTGCEQLTTEWTGADEPSLELAADRQAADSPVAFTASLHIPQDGLEDPDGLATAHLKEARVSLPPGVSLNPAFAQGLKGCSEEQIGLIGTGFPAPNPIHFDTELPSCPAASKIGAATIRTPLFEVPLHGSIFLAGQRDNPFGSDYAIYVSIEERAQGVVAKLPGRVELDQATGRVSATFPNGPQLPFEDLELSLFGGERAAFASPVTCGEHIASTELTPWSAADPDHPRADEMARPTAAVPLTTGPHGSACVSHAAERPFDIDFSAGSREPVAAAGTSFSSTVIRPDGSQELDRLVISPPPGLVASLRGVPYCSEGQIAAATANSGRAEQAAPSCPPASRVGTTDTGAGAGGFPLYLSGRLYLAGPYKGAPLSIVAVTPGLAGPFDLGNVVVRSALWIDPRTARLTAISDPIPRIVKGIPLRIRDVRIDLDRPGWARNPTNCDAMAVNSLASGSDGAVARPSNRFQVRGCESLGFRPRLSIRLSGPTHRSAHPRLRAVLTARPGDANIGRAAVILPKTEYLENAHIRTICTRARFEARTCPAGSAYGYAKAWSPLLDRPLQGPVYLRSSDNRLPDPVAALDGQIRLDLAGRIDSVRGRMRAKFEAVPDLPLSKFELTMWGGRRGLLVNNTQLCRTTPRADAFFRGQNGKAHRTSPAVKVGCG